MTDETIGEWRARKLAQAQRFMERDPSLSVETLDYKTKFVLVHRGRGTALEIGQIHRPGFQGDIDLTDEQIAKWAKPLRKLALS